MKFILQRSTTRPDGWVVTDTENGIVIRFDDGDFNGSQKVSLLNETHEYDLNSLARLVREIAEWTNYYHAELCFSKPYVLRYTEAGEPCVARHKHPRYLIEFHLSPEDFACIPPRVLKSAVRAIADGLENGMNYDAGSCLASDEMPIEVVAIEPISSDVLIRELKKAAAFVNSILNGYVERRSRK